tara:strand:- start:327 stop:1799 length:1473 start_codon:yes stop_codon:yes gene_type:complete
MSKTILCFSRSYLSDLLPHLMAGMPDVEPLHIVQNDAEQAKIEKTGQRVVLNLARLSREAVKDERVVQTDALEPKDFRALTGFDWSPLYADRYLPEFPEPVRSRLTCALIDALESIFAQQRIDGVLSEPVALFPTHYMLYLCKRAGAVPLYWANTYFPGFFYFVSKVHLSNPDNLPPLPEAEMDALRNSIRSYIERVAMDKAGPVYHHQFAKTRRGLAGYLKQRSGHEALVMSPNLSTRAIQAVRLARVTAHRLLFPRLGDYMTAGAVAEHTLYFRNLMASRRGYDAPAQQFSPRNVFFPLQYEPEASLLYAAPDFRNQIAVVESILQALPAGHVLWVKEHPNQFGALMHRRWKALRKRYSNLRLVFGRENGRHLIQRCGLAVSITSSAGLDALIYGRRCLVLGDVFYRNFPGAVALRSNKELARALNDPAQYCTEERGDFELGPLVEALVEFGRGCHPGDPQPSADLYDPENLGQLQNAIRSALAGPAS